METGLFRVNLYDLLDPISKAVDMMDTAVSGHHAATTYIAHHLAKTLEISDTDRRELLTAAILHDIGAFSISDRLELLRFEEEAAEEHCIAGYLLLADFFEFKSAARTIRWHHSDWSFGDGLKTYSEDVPELSHLLHLADRIAVSLKRDRPVLSQVNEIRKAVHSRTGHDFSPLHEEAFGLAAAHDVFWLDLAGNELNHQVKEMFSGFSLDLSMEDFLALAKLICRLIDFKSEFTATHSSGVAVAAESIARSVGFSDRECLMIRIAAHLHDVGKLAVPSEILEKPGELSVEDRHIMRTHVYHSYRILESVPILRDVSSWGALHQERLDGTGYPFGFTASEIPLGSRIMAVADVFTALTENRPYRSGMDRPSTEKTLREMAAKNELDTRLVGILLDEYDFIDSSRRFTQENAHRDYEAFQSRIRMTTSA